jgi:hypothetical protein
MVILHCLFTTGRPKKPARQDGGQVGNLAGSTGSAVGMSMFLLLMMLMMMLLLLLRLLRGSRLRGFGRRPELAVGRRQLVVHDPASVGVRLDPHDLLSIGQRTIEKSLSFRAEEAGHKRKHVVCSLLVVTIGRPKNPGLTGNPP